jgi:serine/threonine protein kinase
MAPEMESRNYYDGRRTDIFAAGVVLFIMYAGCPPFESASAIDPYYRLIRDKRFPTFWKAHSRRRAPEFFGELFKDLLQSMLAFDPNERPTAIQLAEHPWVNGPECPLKEMGEELVMRKERL